MLFMHWFCIFIKKLGFIRVDYYWNKRNISRLCYIIVSFIKNFVNKKNNKRRSLDINRVTRESIRVQSLKV